MKPAGTMARSVSARRKNPASSSLAAFIAEAPGTPTSYTPATRADKRAASAVREERERYGLAHDPIAGLRRMDAVARIRVRAQPVGVGRIAHDRVEIDHRVEMAGLPDPAV